MKRVTALASDAQVSTVVFSAAWFIYFTSGQMQIPEYGSVEYGLPGWHEAIRRFSADLRELVRQGKSVYVVLGSPTGMSPLANLSRSLSGHVSLGAQSLARRYKEPAWRPIAEGLRNAALAAGAYAVDPMQWLCDRDWCAAEDTQGHPIYRDGHHLRASYVRAHATFIDDVMGFTTSSTR